MRPHRHLLYQDLPHVRGQGPASQGTVGRTGSGRPCTGDVTGGTPGTLRLPTHLYVTCDSNRSGDRNDLRHLVAASARAVRPARPLDETLTRGRLSTLALRLASVRAVVVSRSPLTRLAVVFWPSSSLQRSRSVQSHSR